MMPSIDFLTADDELVTLPASYEVCPRCKGEGTHDAWSGGMTSSEMHEQGQEFIEDYFAGRYDVPCTECNGQRVVAVPDRANADPEHLALYDAEMQAEADMAADREAERLAGC